MTDSKQSFPAAVNTLNRQFLVESPGWVWMAGITYSLTQEGWLHLAFVMGLYRWRIVDDKKANPEGLAFLLVLAPRPGLEPGTYGLTVRRSTD